MAKPKKSRAKSKRKAVHPSRLKLPVEHRATPVVTSAASEGTAVSVTLFPPKSFWQKFKEFLG